MLDGRWVGVIVIEKLLGERMRGIIRAEPTGAPAREAVAGVDAEDSGVACMSTLLPLETSRLVLRPFEERDLRHFVAYRSDPSVARYQGWDAPYRLEQATAFLREMRRTRPEESGSWYQVAIE